MYPAQNSGFLDRDETAHALMALGLDRKERGRVFAIFDANNDGMIDIVRLAPDVVCVR